MNNKKLQVKFGKIEQFNSSFSKCNVAIAYHGDNRNMTSISKEVFEKMIPSLYGSPIVGEWQEDDFGSHGGKIEITDGEVKYIDTTVPIGFIDSQAKVWWEDITEDDGTVNEYLCAETILWTGRYDYVNTILNNNSSQSMEIEVTSGHMREDGYYEIESGQFSALCVLGDETEPCFQSSTFGQFNLDKDTFKAEFNLMVKELKESVKGGENVDIEKKDEIEVEEEFVEIEETSIEEKETPIGDEEISTEISLPETDEVVESDVEEVVVEDEPVEEEVETEEVEKEVATDEPVKDDIELDVEDDVTTEEEVVIEVESEEFSELQSQYTNLETEFNLLKSEIEGLREFKSNALANEKSESINEIFANYSTVLDKSDMEDLIEGAMDMELEALEKELSFRLVKKKFDFSKNTKKDSTKLPVMKDTNIEIDPYGSASIYFNK